MIVVVDVNVLISALIRNSTTREIILKSEFDFCFPETSLEKIRKYKGYIKEKSGLSDLEFLKLFYHLIKVLRIIPEEEILRNWDGAKRIMGHIDTEDVTIIATALGQEESVVWSNDKHFDEQNKVITLKTKDVVKLLGE